MSEVDCPQCGGDGSGGNNEFACGLCNGVGSVTRPQPSAEPVAWLHPDWHNHTGLTSPVTVYRNKGWSPLYPASALEAARREALEQAAKVAAQTIFDARTGEIDGDLRCVGHHLETRIRALKENPNG